MFRQGIPEIDLFVEEGTPRCPEPGRYYVFDKGYIVGSHIRLNKAIDQYHDLKKASGYTPAKLMPVDLEKLIAHDQAEDRTARAEIFWDRVNGYSGARYGRRR